MAIHSNHFTNHILFCNQRNNKRNFSLHSCTINQFNIRGEILKMNVIIIILFILNIFVILFSNDTKESIIDILKYNKAEIAVGTMIGTLVVFLVCVIILVAKGDLQ